MDIDEEVDRKIKERCWQCKRGQVLSNCEICGKAIYKRDRDGYPYRTCYECAGLVPGRGY